MTTPKTLHKLLSLVLCTLPVSALAQEMPVKPTMTHNQELSILKDLEQPLKPGQQGMRILTDGSTETPDPTRPVPVTLPNGEKKYLIGLSGQHVILVDSLEDLAKGGLQRLVDVELYNQNGHLYGGEINPANNEPYGYALDSSTWDITLVHAKNANDDGTHMVILAGAMGDMPDGRPSMQTERVTTRRRVFFHDVRFELNKDGSYKIVAKDPRSPLTRSLPKNSNWVVKGRDGKFKFNHGYGGEPVTLPNGDLYIDERGWVPVLHEAVWEQRLLPNPKGRLRKAPYRTVVAVTYMDPTLTKVMERAKPVLDVFKPDGTIWAAAERPSLGPLVEGAHIEVQFQQKPVQSMKHVEDIRRAGGKFDFQMLFSAGEYYSHYGSFVAHSKGGLENFVPVTNSAGELEDFTAPLKPISTWLGRPVSFHDEKGQEYILAHEVNRVDIPTNIPLDTKILNRNHWQYFHRRLFVMPVQHTNENGTDHLSLKDGTGLLETLSHFTPRLGPQPEPKTPEPEAPDAPSGQKRAGAMLCKDVATK